MMQLARKGFADARNQSNILNYTRFNRGPGAQARWLTLTTGTMRPLSVCTATLMSTFLYCRMKSSVHDELTPGCFFMDSAAACTHQAARSS